MDIMPTPTQTIVRATRYLDIPVASPTNSNSMATVSAFYRLEKASYLVSPAEPERASRQAASETTPPPDAHLRATNQGPTHIGPDLPTEEALLLEIEKLSEATLAIDNAFYDIGQRLSDAVIEQDKRVDLYDTCYTLETQWREHHLTYQALLWRSRKFAGEAQAAVDDFRDVVLPSLRDPDMTRSEKEGIIREQIQVLQNTSQPSQDLCQEFLDFGRALDKYIAHFSRVVEGLAINEQSEKVAELEERLYKARAAMDAVSREVKEVGWKLAADVAVTGIALLLACVLPELWTKVADIATISIDCMNAKNSALKFLDARRRSDLAIAEYEVVKAEYELEKACLGQMVKLETTLHESRPLVQEVTMKLGIFASVWAAITADIQKLKNSLDRAQDPTSKLFVRRVQRLEKMYGYLSQALRHYQVKVRLTR